MKSPKFRRKSAYHFNYKGLRLFEEDTSQTNKYITDTVSRTKINVTGRLNCRMKFKCDYLEYFDIILITYFYGYVRTFFNSLHAKSIFHLTDLIALV